MTDAPGPAHPVPRADRRRSPFSLLPVVILSGLLAGLGTGVWLAVDALRWLESPLPVSEPRSITVEPGESMRRLARRLSRQGLLDRPMTWELWARARGAASQLKAGRYRVDPGASPRALLFRIVAGDIELARLTLPEGLRTEEMIARVQAHPDVVTTLQPPTGSALLVALGSDERSAEGRLFPDTYLFAPGASDIELLHQAWTRMERVLAEIWSQRRGDLPLDSPDALLTLASIVEKETGMPEDRGRIAAVFLRRLQLGMRLQSDPTVIYGLGDAFDGNLTRAHLRRDTPWNTYRRNGLPPTPIAAPGRAALMATARPDSTDALYFVARGDGHSVFSRTLDEHNAAVARYQQGREGDLPRQAAEGSVRLPTVESPRI